MKPTFYWHDYETWGVDPSIDRPSQFAGVRTDMDLNIIEEPLVAYCQPPPDIWPSLQACLITGITPQHAMEQGEPEFSFIQRIHHALSQPGTCGVGYNSIRFDDEVTRYTLYRNFFEPYDREWKHGCSRWDIIDMVRLAYALRPQGLEWPMMEGRPSFKLEHLSAANGLSHEAAHDAYSDVAATIQLAKALRQAQPDLYQYVLDHRSKNKVASLIDWRKRKPLLHVSSKISAAQGCTTLVVPLAPHPDNRNAVIVYDLSVDPTPLQALSAEEIRQRVFTAADELPEGVDRIPLKLVHINKCPILATPKLLSDAAALRLNIQKPLCEAHWQTLYGWDIAEKLQQVFSEKYSNDTLPPEAQLYGGFIDASDKPVMLSLRQEMSMRLNASKEERCESFGNYLFEDTRLNAMLLPFKARNCRDALTMEEGGEWHEFVVDRLLHGDAKCASLFDVLEQWNTVVMPFIAGEKKVSQKDVSVLLAYAQYLLQQDEKFHLSSDEDVSMLFQGVRENVAWLQSQKMS